MNSKKSGFSGFHRLPIEERLELVAEHAVLDGKERQTLSVFGNLPEETANGLVENVVGVMGIPLGVATNLILDGREVLVPMATDESSVIAAVCNAAKQCHGAGGVVSSVSGTEMNAQIQLLGLPDPNTGSGDFAEEVSHLFYTQNATGCTLNAVSSTTLNNGPPSHRILSRNRFRNAVFVSQRQCLMQCFFRLGEFFLGRHEKKSDIFRDFPEKVSKNKGEIVFES